jgi:mono/diheme cytochrome c family protein
MIRPIRSNTLSACTQMGMILMGAILAVAGVAGCKHPAQQTGTLKATAAGTAIVESSGGHQLGATGTALKDPLVVQVNDDQGTSVVGALVEFHGPSGVSFDPAALLTDSSGQATTVVTLGTVAGRYQLSAVTPGKSKPVARETVETALGYQQRLGGILNDKYCSRCHNPESSPEQVSNFDNLEVKPHAFAEGSTLNKMSDADLTAIIQHGGPALNRSALMPPYGNTLTPADVRALIAYIRAVADPPYEPAGTVYARK